MNYLADKEIPQGFMPVTFLSYTGNKPYFSANECTAIPGLMPAHLLDLSVVFSNGEHGSKIQSTVSAFNIFTKEKPEELMQLYQASQNPYFTPDSE